jgi:hypothetical protein
LPARGWKSTGVQPTIGSFDLMMVLDHDSGTFTAWSNMIAAAISFPAALTPRVPSADQR